MVVFSSGGGTSGYGNLPYVLSMFQSTTWWLNSGANVHVCYDTSLCFFLPCRPKFNCDNGGWVIWFCSWCCHSRSEVTLEKIVQLKNVQYVPSINKNLVSCSLLCRDGFKVVLESSKFVVSKCG
jgi:hypothetical protein